MLPVGSVYPSAANALARVDAPRPKLPALPLPGADQVAAPPSTGFGNLLEGLVSTVDAKEATAGDLTRKVLLGESDQLHQSVIAMQEASVAFSLRVEVRNKLVESYQELMRMQA